MNNREAQEGSPSPMGVSFVTSQQAWNFALYSKHAIAVTLHLYRDSNTELELDQSASLVSIHDLFS